MSDNCCLEDSLARYVGQTVTIFTTSGGLSGSGFTGVLAFVGNGCVKLITSIGAAPACAVGSPCSDWGRNDCGCRDGGRDNWRGGYRGGWNGGGWSNGWGNGWGYGWGNGYCDKDDDKYESSCECNNHNHHGNWLGSVTEIPIDRIASFSHNAI